MVLLAQWMKKISGKSREQDDARAASQAALMELRDDMRHLTTMLRPYIEADDPLVALMVDVFNQRQVIQNDRPPN
ncbi:hypothetical protein [Bradyrhizobium sp. 150]|uniref:hypothetical protein n=1 Tax=Bradyrhizobium sp. 150 TaxID=2782625 RepID=UPI001FFA8DF9|nr:hypothetical protein [Bradyrhizobium sp. 150]MCK1670324.1 hypothetical protein [Bradyrhizobium sp. 150]